MGKTYIILVDSLHYGNLHILEYSIEAIRCHVYHYKCLEVTAELAAMGFVPVHSGWNSRDVNMSAVWDCVKESN